jgi:hypothetical protein
MVFLVRLTSDLAHATDPKMAEAGGRSIGTLSDRNLLLARPIALSAARVIARARRGELDEPAAQANRRTVDDAAASMR